MCFGFATTSIAMSLAVNLNPLMRFDGYFALSDYWQVPNLQTRAFALGSWKLRELLFGLSAPPPEQFPPRKRRMLIVYAYGVWVYRFFLYLGIAYLVCVMAGKAIGIVLGSFELIVFIVRPIWHEVKSWWKVRGSMRGSWRARLTATAAACALILLCTPCLSTIESPGVLVAGEEQEVHLSSAARLTSVNVKPGQIVQAGDVLFEAESGELDHELHKAALKARLSELRLARLMANATDREQAVVLVSENKAAREKYAGIQRARRKLHVVAPFSGRIADLDSALAAGTWVSELDVLARVISTEDARAKGFVSDADINRIASGARGVFIADEVDLQAQNVVVESVAPASNGKLSEPVLGEINGGPILSVSKDRELKARDGWFEVSYAVPAAPPPARVIRGIIKVEAQPHSPLSVIWRRIGAVMVREQSF